MHSLKKRQPADREAEKEARRAALLTGSRGLHRGTYAGGVVAAAPAAREKVPGKKRQAIRDSARGEECTVRLPGICANDPAATIWSHARWLDAGKGGATKSLDLAGAYACTACDAAYDGQRKPPPGYTREDIDRDWCMGHFRSLVRLAQKGLL